jgi:hypothetical protein
LRQRLEDLRATQKHACPALDNPPPAGRRTLKLDLTDAPDDAIGQRIGRYKLLEKLGEGGCGVVFAAEQTEPGAADRWGGCRSGPGGIYSLGQRSAT